VGQRAPAVVGSGTRSRRPSTMDGPRLAVSGFGDQQAAVVDVASLGSTRFVSPEAAALFAEPMEVAEPWSGGNHQGHQIARGVPCPGKQSNRRCRPSHKEARVVSEHVMAVYIWPHPRPGCAKVLMGHRRIHHGTKSLVASDHDGSDALLGHQHATARHGRHHRQLRRPGLVELPSGQRPLVSIRRRGKCRPARCRAPRTRPRRQPGREQRLHGL